MTNNNAVTTTTFYAPITTLEWPVDYLSMQGEVELETAAILVDADSRKPAYSKWDAKVTFDGNVQVIDIATSAEILRITAHDGTATAVAIIPDRSRPITAGEDRTVRFYDLVTGREAAVIRIQQGVKNLISSPDGSRFVLRLSDGSAEIWDIRSRKERQTNWALRGAEQKPAREYLASLSTGSTQMGDLKQAVRDEPTLTPLRKLVILEMLDSHASSAERIVRNLKTTNDFNKARIRDSVNQMMLDDRTKIVAQFVLELVDRWEPTANELLGAAWELFLLPDPSPTDYAAALDSAQKAAILEPDDCVIINTLGVAEYRVGLFQNAIDTLAKSEALCAAEGETEPSNLIFSAMAKFRLGDAAGARALLDQVREQSRLSNERLNDQNAKFLQEAEALLAKPAADTPGSPDAPPVSDTEPSE